MSAPQRKNHGGGATAELVLLWTAISLVLMTTAVVAGGQWLGRLLGGAGPDLPANPLQLVLGTFTGDLPWSGAATAGAVLIGLVLLGAAAGVLRLVLAGKRRRSTMDVAAAHMGRGRDIEVFSRKAAQQKAERLGVDSPGVFIGNTVAGNQPLYGSWEDTHIDIWGPRRGKTTSRAVPAIVAAPGACVVTSNKRDIVDDTRGVREQQGDVWVFDPQGVVEEPANWWWNPLSYVTDEVKAEKLADHFASAATDPEARTDAHFDPAGRALLSHLLLAAALDDRPITEVLTWLSDKEDRQPLVILREHGMDTEAVLLEGKMQAPDDEKGSIYSTAMMKASCLRSRQVQRWVTRQGPEDHRPQFDPQTFVRGANTLYSVSVEGSGTAGGLVTALTVATVEAAEELGKRSRGGRLATPMMCVLDEAANVCRWSELPSMYSHFGSRGIVVMTILQSWEQGVGVWGKTGMGKMWSAANVRVYGGGASDDDFLRMLREQIGEYRYQSVSSSHSRHGRSLNLSSDKDDILSVADLAALPFGRAIVFGSGARPTMIRTVPWMDTDHAEAIRASHDKYDPAGVDALTPSQQSLPVVAGVVDQAPAPGAPTTSKWMR